MEDSIWDNVSRTVTRPPMRKAKPQLVVMDWTSAIRGIFCMLTIVAVTNFKHTHPNSLMFACCRKLVLRGRRSVSNLTFLLPLSLLNSVCTYICTLSNVQMCPILLVNAFPVSTVAHRFGDAAKSSLYEEDICSNPVHFHCHAQCCITRPCPGRCVQIPETCCLA